MKKRITVLMAAITLLAFLAIPMGVWGQTSVTWPGTTALPGTATAVANDQNVTIMVSSTNPYTNPIRIYANTTVTINALNGAKILSVAYEASSTGNYVTNAQNATVTPNVTPTVSGKIVTWTYAESANVTKFTFTPSAQTRSNGITITYITSSSSSTCATPTFNPAAGTYTEAQNVSISCATEGATIYYTTNGQDPTTNSTVYSGAINVSSDMTIKAMATAEGYDNSAIATAAFTIVNIEHAGTEANPYTVADARNAIDANVGVTGVYATGIVSEIVTAYNSTYENITFDIVDEVGNSATLRAYRCGGTEAANVAVNDIVVVYGDLTKYGSTYEFGQGCTLVSLTHPTSTEPSITVTPATLNVDAQQHLVNYLDLAYENIDVVNSGSFTVHYYNAEGDEIQLVPGEAWMTAGVAKPNDVYQVLCTIIANEGEARTAYFKLSALDAENNTVYSNLVTVNQEAYVAPTYAELPFSFNGGKDDIENTDGLYQKGLGSDYNASTNPNTQLKFDNTGDWLLLQFDERPGTLTFDIKGNSFSGSTFTVQTSEDGETFTDLKSYTDDNFGNTVYSEEFTNLGENVRYIKWIYTEKVQSGGNVGLGNIALAEYEVPVIVPSITITPDNFELDANSHMAEVLAPITYQNIVVVSGSGTESFDVQYYDAEGQEIEQTWCTVGAVANGDTAFNLSIAAGVNEGNEARTAYFKLYGHDEEANVVYSNLVTVTQAAPVIDYAVLPFVWEGGPKADFLALNGVTAQGLGSDYASGNAPYLIKFDNTGDYIQVKCDQQPGKVTIGVKMIGGGDTSTITIQGSADGETFTDIEVLTISGDQNDVLTLETTNVFADADRYVRMLFTKGSNVGVGPITIEKGSAPSIAVTPATLDLEATGTGQNGEQLQQFVVTYHNLDIESHSDFAVQFYDAEGEEQGQPAWITPNPAYVAGGNEEGYMVILFIEGNTGVARSAYFKVSALDADENEVYSNLVTINQAGAPQQYTLTVEPFENLELITFVNDEMVLEGDGEITVTEGDEIMLSVVALEGYVMKTLMVNGVNHVNDIANDFTYTFEMPDENVTISATAIEFTPFEPATYTLATTIESGKTYIITSEVFVDEIYAMGEQTNNNRAAVAATIEGTTVTVETDAVYEVVITLLDETTEDGDALYSIFDARNNGYLYAASSSANHLKTQAELDGNGKWTIEFGENGVTIKAQGSNTKNWMRYNGNNNLFSCYGSGQSDIYLYVKDESTSTVTQTIELTAGVNWVSFYVETTLDDVKAALQSTGGTNIILKAKDSYTTWNGRRWVGTLSGFDVNQMFMVTVQEDCEIALEGMLLNPADHPITISEGANWIGFPFNEIMTIANAFTGFPANQDLVKGQNSYTTWNGRRWVGSLTTLEPGKGYIYTSNASEDKTFVFPTNSSKATQNKSFNNSLNNK